MKCIYCEEMFIGRDDTLFPVKTSQPELSVSKRHNTIQLIHTKHILLLLVTRVVASVINLAYHHDDQQNSMLPLSFLMNGPYMCKFPLLTHSSSSMIHKLPSSNIQKLHACIQFPVELMDNSSCHYRD